MITAIAESLGTSEPALKLVVTLLIAYPLALIHRLFLYGKSPNLQHLFFMLVGLSLSYYNYGTDMVHMVICVVILYGILLAFGGTHLSIAISFIFFMAYLLTAYYCTATKDYDIKWTLPHCVLTLRLIGLTFDVFDGTKSFESLSVDQKKTALLKVPSFLEISGYCYFFGGFMVGPQFSMNQYLSFVHQRLPESAFTGKPSCYTAAALNLLKGIIIMALYQVGSKYLPEKYLLTEEFEQFSLLTKILIVGAWSKVCLAKYVSCWLISEGSCILTGLTYNGVDKKGNVLWNGCNNVDLLNYELTTSFGGVIKSFNINTNLWVAQYIFKRLKFLGSKMLSQLLALVFLAVWHGLHSGYYVCFLNEFIVMKMERDIQTIVHNSPFLTKLTTYLRIPIAIFLKIYVTCFLGYCLIPFVLLSYDRWVQAYKSVYFIGHIIYLGWPVVYYTSSFLARRLFRAQRPKVEPGIEKKEN